MAPQFSDAYLSSSFVVFVNDFNFVTSNENIRLNKVEYTHFSSTLIYLHICVYLSIYLSMYAFTLQSAEITSIFFPLLFFSCKSRCVVSICLWCRPLGVHHYSTWLQIISCKTDRLDILLEIDDIIDVKFYLLNEVIW